MSIRSLITTLVLFASIHGVEAEGFIRNAGQWDGSYAYKINIPGGAAFLDDDGIVFHLVDQRYNEAIHHGQKDVPTTRRHHAFKIEFVGSNDGIIYKEERPAEHYLNYYLGNDQSAWVTGIVPQSTVIYQDVYDGVDLHVMEFGASLKYEFHLDEGVDPSIIKLQFHGLSDLDLLDNGDLMMRTELQDIRETKPVIYQTRGDKKYQVEGSFELVNDLVTYSIPSYDEHMPMVIDPEIIFSTYSGSSSDNWGFTAAPDQSGFLYAGGIVLGTGYPSTLGVFDASFNSGTYDVGITKYDTTGTALIFSTYLGGDDVEQPHSLIVDEDDNLYVMGTTGSDDFPTTNSAFDQSFNGGSYFSADGVRTMEDGADIFITRFNSTGTGLLGSTYIGGDGNDGLNDNSTLSYNYSDEFRGEINLDDDSSVLVATSTQSTNFPTTTGSFDQNSNGLQDGVVFKMNSNLNSMLWSGYLGGQGEDACYGVDIASDGSVYVCGGTNSTDFPGTNNVLYSSFQGGTVDAFIAHISEDGDDLLEATYYGTGAYDQIYFVQLDRQDRPNFFGQTEHGGSGLIFNAQYFDAGGGQIVGVLNADLTARVWTSQFGSTQGQPNISPTAFLVDVCNQMYLSGWGGALNQNFSNNASDVAGLDVTNDAFQSSPDFNNSDFYLCVIASDGNTLEFGTFYGGAITQDHVDGGTSRFDRSGKIYQSVCASCGGEDDFPIVPDPGAWSETNNSGNCNNAVYKIDFELPIVIADFKAPPNACAPFTTTLLNNSVTQSSTTFSWDLGNGQTSTATNPSVTYTQKGTYTIRLIVNDPTSCNLHDTLEKEIDIYVDTNYALTPIDTCIGQPVELGPDPNDYTGLGNATITWFPANLVSNPSLLNPSTTLSQSTLFRLVIDYGGCQERILQQVNIDRYPVSASDDTIICSDFTPFQVTGTAFGAAQLYEWSNDPTFNNIIGTDSILQINSLNNALTYFYLRTTKPNGCQMYDTLLVTLSDLDMELTPDTLICKNEDVMIQASSRNPLNTFSYYWTTGRYSTDPNDFLTDTNNSFLDIQLQGPQTYYLIANSTVVPGCIARDSTRVSVSTLDKLSVTAFSDQDTIYRGELVQLIGTPENYVHYWYSVAGGSNTPNNGYMDDSLLTDPTARTKYNTDYIYVATDVDNEQCTFRDTVSIHVREIVCDTPEVFVPTGFSPNGDGNNDELVVRGSNIKTMTFQVFDRWGKQMFESNDPAIGWNGFIDGVLATRGVYVYQLEATCFGDVPYYTKGNITLHR